MSKARDIRLHEETMEKLDTLSCQLHSLSNTVRKQSADKLVRGPSITAAWVDEAATWTADEPVKKAISWWEQQCREKDATLTETLRKLQASDEQITELAEKNAAYVEEILRQREEIAALNVQQADFTTYKGVQIDCEATRAALDAIIKDFLSRPKVKA
jgi:alpha-beta hydrolase superfamily lysophospholipase